MERLGRVCRALLLAAGMAAAHVSAQARPPEPVRAALVAAGVPEEAMAFAVLPLDGGFGGAQWQAARPMQPGSTMKLVTSAVALDSLGPQHRPRTELLSHAPREGDRLRGDLVLRGGGDPELTLEKLWALLNELRLQGIRAIDGDILLDRSLFSPERTDIGQPPFDSAPEWEYNVIPDALHLTASLLPLELDSRSGALRARALPPLPGVVFDTAGMNLVEAPCREWGSHWRTPAHAVAADGTATIALAGAFPRGCLQRAALQLIDRDLLAERTLRWLWESMGGQWSGRARPGRAGADAAVLASRLGRPWGELLRHLNKASDNAWTRILYLSIGAQAQGRLGPAASAVANHPVLAAAAASATRSSPAAGGEPRTADAAAVVVRRWFARHGIADDGLVVDNGSGLSRTERISPRQLARLLQVALKGRHAPELLMSLPQPGVDGTMARRLKDTPAEGTARLKTGTLANVRALAGTVTDPQGRVWVMSAMVNHERAPQGAFRAVDALAQWIASGGLSPRATEPGPGQIGGP